MLSPNMADDLYEFGQTLSMFKELVMPRFLVITASSWDDYSPAGVWLKTIDFDRFVADAVDLRESKLKEVAESRDCCVRQYQEECLVEYQEHARPSRTTLADLEAEHQELMSRHAHWESQVLADYGEKYIEWAKTARPGDHMDGPLFRGGETAVMFLAVPDDWPVNPEEEVAS